MNTRVFLWCDGRTFPRLSSWRIPFLAGSVVQLDRWLTMRRNPRSRDYMERLARRHFPSFHPADLLMATDAAPPAFQAWAASEEIVLLWPDATGTGWSGIERAVMARRPAGAAVLVLNGRGRLFTLTPARWRAFRWRRALEKALLPNVALALTLTLVGGWLALWDAVRGRT